MRKNLKHLLALSLFLSVIILTFSGCALIERRYGETCNTRAYVVTDVEGYLRTRYQRNSPVRLAIIPFTTPANLTPYDPQAVPALGNQFAWRVQAEFLRKQTFPIIEVLDRQDWPGKKDEYFTGNRGALESALNAGYDLALVGSIDQMYRADTYVVNTKLIDIESGITLWYGRHEVTTNRDEMEETSGFFGLTNQRPDLYWHNALLEKGARCIVSEVLRESGHNTPLF